MVTGYRLREGSEGDQDTILQEPVVHPGDHPTDSSFTLDAAFVLGKNLPSEFILVIFIFFFRERSISRSMIFLGNNIDISVGNLY